MATSKSNNLVNPNAREAMNRFKMEAASEVGVVATYRKCTSTIRGDWKILFRRLRNLTDEFIKDSNFLTVWRITH